MIPVVYRGGSVNYQRYCSLYLEVMRTSAGFLNAVAPNMKLEQSIQQPKKVSDGINGQTKQNAFVTEWELACHEVLAISKSYSNITRSILVETDTTKLNKELLSKNMKKYYEAVKQVFDFFNERGNPYKVTGPAKLHHFKASCTQR